MYFSEARIQYFETNVSGDIERILSAINFESDNQTLCVLLLGQRQTFLVIIFEIRPRTGFERTPGGSNGVSTHLLSGQEKEGGITTDGQKQPNFLFTSSIIGREGGGVSTCNFDELHIKSYSKILSLQWYRIILPFPIKEENQPTKVRIKPIENQDCRASMVSTTYECIHYIG